MAILDVDLTDPADVRAGLNILTKLCSPGAPIPRVGSADVQFSLTQAVVEMKRKKIWQFLHRVASLDVPEYSLPELGGQIGISSSKVCSLRAILAKPEQRLGVQFFERPQAAA